MMTLYVFWPEEYRKKTRYVKRFQGLQKKNPKVRFTYMSYYPE